MSFQQPSYVVNEGSDVTVGLTLNRPALQQYTVTVTSRDRSAFGMYTESYLHAKLLYSMPLI